MDTNGEKMMSLGTLVIARNVFDECSNVDINPKTAYKLMKILDVTAKDYTFYFDKVRSLVEKYGERDEEGQLITDENGNARIPNNVVQEVQAQIGDIEAIEVSVPDKYLVALDELDELKLSCRKMKAIMPFIFE